MRGHGWLIVFAFATGPARLSAEPALSAVEIVERSVRNNEQNWKASPQYSYVENDIITKGGRTIRRKYQVWMIEGSTYNQLLAENGQPLPPARAKEEARRLERERGVRKNETPAQRQRRVAKFQQERRQDHALMRAMVQGFDFKLIRTETVSGRECYLLEASPKPGYRPPNRDTKVLTGMRGKMWVDTQQFQWVKVHAEVFRPVAFGLFIAHVQPGTEFTLEEAPVTGGIWLPSHFSMHVKASILGVWSRVSADDERYSDYRPLGEGRPTTVSQRSDTSPGHR